MHVTLYSSRLTKRFSLQLSYSTLNSQKKRALLGTYHSILILLPIQAYAFGHSRMFLFFFFVAWGTNSIFHSRDPFQLGFYGIYISLCHYLSPTFSLEDFCIVHAAHLWLLVLIYLLQENTDTLQELYQNQSLYMASVYHEINTPMNGITCATELALGELQTNEEKDSIDRKKVFDWIQIIRVNSLTLNQMIQNMTYFSLFQSKAPDSSGIQCLDLAGFLPSFWEKVLTHPRENGVEILYQDESHGAGILVNQELLQLALMNILSNSLKFTHKGTILFKVLHDRIRNEILFEVKDSGIGMSQDFLKSQLYKPFKQEQHRVTSEQRGMGLGLTIAKSMIEKMNGTIQVSSRRGYGTTILISLPACEPVKGSPMPSAEALPPLTLPILIVDDNRTNRKVMEHLFRNIGFKCRVASSGEEAIEEVKRTIPGGLVAVVMDVWMPGIGGLAAAEEITNMTRDWPRRPLLIGCSADTSPQTQSLCRQKGISRFLSKPLDKQRINELKGYLSRRFST